VPFGILVIALLACGKRSDPKACPGFGTTNVPERAWAVLESGDDVFTFRDDGTIDTPRSMKQEKLHAMPADVEKTKAALVASKVYDLKGGCWVGKPIAAPTDEAYTHLWLVRDHAVGYEFGYANGREMPREISDADAALRKLVRAAK